MLWVPVGHVALVNTCGVPELEKRREGVAIGNFFAILNDVKGC